MLSSVFMSSIIRRGLSLFQGASRSLKLSMVVAALLPNSCFM